MASVDKVPAHLDPARWSNVCAIGLDVGATRVHAIGLDSRGVIAAVAEIDAANARDLAVTMCAPGPLSIGIDGPAGHSAGAYADDHTLAPKFRTARGSEIALGRQRRIWVPYPTPVTEAAMAPWMRVAAGLFGLAEEHRHTPLETYPHGVFVTLAGGARLARKTTPEGGQARVALLRNAGLDVPVTGWTHHLLDAAACALVALDHHRGTAECLRGDRDGTAAWLPAPR